MVPRPTISFPGILQSQREKNISWPQEQPLCLLLSLLSSFTLSSWSTQQEEASQGLQPPQSRMPTSI